MDLHMAGSSVDDLLDAGYSVETLKAESMGLSESELRRLKERADALANREQRASAQRERLNSTYGGNGPQ